LPKELLLLLLEELYNESNFSCIAKATDIDHKKLEACVYKEAKEFNWLGFLTAGFLKRFCA
jgi:hypothetical protein